MPGHTIRHGMLRGLIHGSKHGSSIYDTNGFTGFGLIFGDSNAVGAANYGASGQSDTFYGVSDTVGYAPVTMRSFYATGVTDPLVINDTTTETLRAYAAPPGLNIGQEQTLGRRLYQRGIAAAPIIIKWAVSGSIQHTNWRTDSTSPITGGNMHAQLVQFVKDRQVEFGRQLDFAVYVLGENDTGSTTNANATQADMGNTIQGLRTALGRPTLPVFVMRLNTSTTGASTSTVCSQQDAYIASDPYCVGVYTSDIVLASNPHYGANGYYDLGDRVCDAVARYFFPTKTFNLETPSAFPRLQDQAAAVTINASPATGKPRSGPDIADGDFQLLVVTSQATDPTYTLTTAAGFTALGSGKFQSVFSGTNFRSMIVYWRVVDAATLAANNGTMPCPVIDCGTVATSEAVIFTIRGPNKFTANPVDLFVTGGNAANNTSLSIGGGTTTAANELAIVLCSVPGNTGTVSSCVNANLQGISKRRESLVAQSSTIGLAMFSAQVPASGTVIGSTAITMSAAGNNVGCLITIKP